MAANRYGQIWHGDHHHINIRFPSTDARLKFQKEFEEYHASHDHEGDIPTFKCVTTKDLKLSTGSRSPEDLVKAETNKDYRITIDGYSWSDIHKYHNPNGFNNYFHYHVPTCCVPPIIVVDREFMDSDTLQRHDLSAFFPDMPDDAFQNLVDSIATDGVIDNIIKIYEGQILDGWHRFRACQELNLLRKLRFQDYDTRKDGDPVAFVFARNLHRKHHSAAQLAQIGIARNRLVAHGGDRSKSSEDDLKTREQLSKELGVSTSTIDRAVAVEKTGRSQEVIDGDKSASQVLKEETVKDLWAEVSEEMPKWKQRHIGVSYASQSTLIEVYREHTDSEQEGAATVEELKGILKLMQEDSKAYGLRVRYLQSDERNAFETAQASYFKARADLREKIAEKEIKWSAFIEAAKLQYHRTNIAGMFGTPHDKREDGTLTVGIFEDWTGFMRVLCVDVNASAPWVPTPKEPEQVEQKTSTPETPSRLSEHVVQLADQLMAKMDELGIDEGCQRVYLMEKAAKHYSFSTDNLEKLTDGSETDHQDFFANCAPPHIEAWCNTLTSMINDLEHGRNWAPSRELRKTEEVPAEVEPDPEGCRKELKRTLSAQGMLNKSNVDTRALSETYHLSMEEVRKLKDEVWTDGLATAKAKHKTARHCISKEWLDWRELSDATTLDEVQDAACNQFAFLSKETFDISREKLAFVDYAQLQREIDQLEKFEGCLVARAGWLQALIPKKEASVHDSDLAKEYLAMRSDIETTVADKGIAITDFYAAATETHGLYGMNIFRPLDEIIKRHVTFQVYSHWCEVLSQIQNDLDNNASWIETLGSVDDTEVASDDAPEQSDLEKQYQQTFESVQKFRERLKEFGVSDDLVGDALYFYHGIEETDLRTSPQETLQQLNVFLQDFIGKPLSEWPEYIRNQVPDRELVLVSIGISDNNYDEFEMVEFTDESSDEVWCRLNELPEHLREALLKIAVEKIVAAAEEAE